MTDILAEICAKKREHIAQQKADLREGILLKQAKAASKPRGFRKALLAKTEAGEIGLIAEIKKASPSGGLIRRDFNPVVLAVAYAKGGAACLSVLTDKPYFQGDDDHLRQARAAVELPVLRKDFMLDPYQIVESRVLGADCVLLIMAILSDAQAQEMKSVATELGMDVLVEVHDREELDRALAHVEPDMVGINNRNLKTLEVDLSTSETLAKDLPAHILPVCESGIRTPLDVWLMRQAGLSCFLVGEALMRKQDVRHATEQLLGKD